MPVYACYNGPSVEALAAMEPGGFLMQDGRGREWLVYIEGENEPDGWTVAVSAAANNSAADRLDRLGPERENGMLMSVCNVADAEAVRQHLSGIDPLPADHVFEAVYEPNADAAA